MAVTISFQIGEDGICPQSAYNPAVFLESVIKTV